MKVIASSAVSADGYLDDLGPDRLILSSPEDWQEVYAQRAACDAILVGAETLRRDNPALVIRDGQHREERKARGMAEDLAKVTVSRSGNLDPGLRFFTEGGGRKIVFLEGSAPCDPALEGMAEVIRAEKITARHIAEQLAARGMSSLMVEGGSRVLSMFFGEDMVDEFRLAVAPFFVAEPGAPRLLKEEIYPFGKERRMTLREIRQLGDMAVMYYDLKKRLAP